MNKLWLRIVGVFSLVTLISIAEGADPLKVTGTYVGGYGGKHSGGDWSETSVFHFYHDGEFLKGVMIADYPLYRFELPEVVDDHTYKGEGVYPWWDRNEAKIKMSTEKVTITWTNEYTEFRGTWNDGSSDGWFKGSNESVSQKAPKEYCIVNENQDKTRQAGIYSHENFKSIEVFGMTCGEWGKTVGLDEAIRGAVNYNQKREEKKKQQEETQALAKAQAEEAKKPENIKKAQEKELRETLVAAYGVYQVIKYCYQIREGYAMVYVNDTEMANAKKQVKTIENTITSMIEVDTDAAWKESIEGATNIKKLVDLDIALANTPNWDQCDMFLLALEEESVKYGMKPESEKKDF